MDISVYKTNTIEDTELIYTILREKYPNKQIEIEFNDNTKDYTLKLTEKEFICDPEVPLNVTIKVIYGDSCTGDTPLLLMKNGKTYIETIQSIFDHTKKVEYPGFKMFDQTIRLEKEYSLTDYKVWTDIGWVNINKVIRHKCDKKIFRVLTNKGCVDVTEDHSLICENKKSIKPGELKIGDTLLHSYPTEFDKSLYETDDFFKKTGVIFSVYNSKLEAAKAYYNYYFINKSVVYIEWQDRNRYKSSNMMIDNSIENNVKQIIELGKINDFVYDLETDIGRFNLGIGQLVGFNTDSVFLSIKFNRKDFEQNRKDAFKLAIQCGDNITNDVFKRPPIDLEFEKVYQPFILLTKKRYIGKKFEDTRDPLKLKTLTTSGIAITKRNYCNMVKKCYKQVIDIIMDSSDLDEAISVYKKYIDRIDNYQIDTEDLVISAQIGKEYSCKTCKKKVEWIIKCDKCKTLNPKMDPICKGTLKNKPCNKKFECLHTFSLGHINLAQKFLFRNDEICIGDRIQYIFVENDNTNVKSELTEDPTFAKNNNIKYNRGCYLEQLAKSIMGFFKVVLQNEEELIDDLLEFTNEKLVEYGSTKLKISDFKITDE